MKKPKTSKTTPRGMSFGFWCIAPTGQWYVGPGMSKKKVKKVKKVKK